MMMQSGFFDLQDRYRKLSERGDPLEAINQVVAWERFRPILQRGLKQRPRGPAGRKPLDPVLMFKVLVLQSLYNLSDEQTEYQIRDRFSFLRFLGLTPESRVPDEKTVWLFRETLKEAGLIEKLFATLEAYLAQRGYTAQKGSVVDARIVAGPKQRNTREGSELIQAGLIPAKGVGEQAERGPKDIEAR